jgi:hypothetical protein
MNPLLKKILLLLPAVALLFIWACTVADEDGDQYLRIELSETLKDYHRVLITLSRPDDSNAVYDTVWNDSIPDPKNFPRFKLKLAKGKDFTVRIRAFNGMGETVWAKNISIVGETALPGTTVKADLRIFSLSLSKGTLTPIFNPATLSYRAEVGDSVENIVIAAKLMDSANIFTVNDLLVAPGQPVPQQALKKGENTFKILIRSAGTGSLEYTIVVARGGSIIDTSINVTSLTMTPESLSVYKGEVGKALTAAVLPSDVPLYWSSQNDAIAAVDGTGKVTGMDSGTTTIIVRAGKLAATAKVTVIKDAPVMTVGDNVAVKLNSEVVFPISVSQKNGTIKAFKYDLEGDGAWDNADSLSGAYPATLAHTYNSAATKTFIARFYVRDSEGNEVEITRKITVSDAEFLITIVSPSKDTLVNKSPITVRYVVNGTPLTRTFPLIEGMQPLTVDTGSGTSKVTATVNVTYDKTPPKVKITSPKDSTFTNANSIVVAWTVDSTLQTTQTSEDLGTVDGVKPIVRQSSDVAGNVGEDIIRVIRDTQAPSAPAVTGSSPRVPGAMALTGCVSTPMPWRPPRKQR